MISDKWLPRYTHFRNFINSPLRCYSNQINYDKNFQNYGGLINKHLRKNKTQIFQAKWQKLQISAFRLISQWKLQVAIATKVVGQGQ